MNKTPSILVDTGFEVDANGVLTEIVTPNVVDTLSAPTKVTFNGTKINWIPSTAAMLQEFNAPNATDLTVEFNTLSALQTIRLPSLATKSNGLVKGCNNLTTLYLPNIKSFTSTSVTSRVIYNCSSLSSLDFPNLESLACTGNAASIFEALPAVHTINFPKLKTISDTGTSNMFYTLNSLESVTLPEIQTIKGRIFIQLTSLQNVTLGSEGHPVQSITNLSSNSTVFHQCTQSGLTITIYTQGGAALSGSPWGATNATIVYEEA